MYLSENYYQMVTGFRNKYRQLNYVERQEI